MAIANSIIDGQVSSKVLQQKKDTFREVCPAGASVGRRPLLPPGRVQNDAQARVLGAERANGRVAHVAGAEISQKPLSLSVPESSLYISAGLYLLGNGQLSTRR